MTTIEQAIRDAVEKGGYPKAGNLKGVYDSRAYAAILLDRAFWAALGRARGWPEEKDNAGETRGDGQWHQTYTLNSSLENWHRFINHLAEGKTAEEFFQSL